MTTEALSRLYSVWHQNRRRTRSRDGFNEECWNNAELNNLYSNPNPVRLMTSRMMRRTGHAARVVGKWCAQRISVAKCVREDTTCRNTEVDEICTNIKTGVGSKLNWNISDGLSWHVINGSARAQTLLISSNNHQLLKKNSPPHSLRLPKYNAHISSFCNYLLEN
jgi:hypothetical protein